MRWRGYMNSNCTTSHTLPFGLSTLLENTLLPLFHTICHTQEHALLALQQIEML